MSQLAAAPRQLSAKQLKKAKEIRKVKTAIKWHERARKQRQAIVKDRWDTKQLLRSQKQWSDKMAKVKRKALENAKEDWNLGPLRPNRAVGPDAAKYGAATIDMIRRPEITAQVHKRMNDYREKKGQEAEYPLVVDNEKYFPIVKGDRVVVIKGRDRNKIGIVKAMERSGHGLTIEGINKYYIDSDVFGAPPGEQVSAMEASEIPIPMSDVRLVIPYQTIKYSFDKDGNRLPGRKTVKDVIVDKIVMERHTTGIDPFTGTDYGEAEIPKEHQYDPRTGLPIFHRYIAGTNHEIEWPWQKSKSTEKTKTDEHDPLNHRTAMRKIGAIITHPKVAWNRLRNKGKVAKPKDQTVDEMVHELGPEFEDIEASERSRLKQETPRSSEKSFTAYDGHDTTRNLVDDGQDLRYTLVQAPYPPEIVDELRNGIHKLRYDIRRKENEHKSPSERELEKAWSNIQNQDIQEQLVKKQNALEQMKTPLQLRWERDQAQKLAAEYMKPKVDQNALLIALGQHMQSKGVTLTPERKKAASALEELD